MQHVRYKNDLIIISTAYFKKYLNHVLKQVLIIFFIFFFFSFLFIMYQQM